MGHDKVAPQFAVQQRRTTEQMCSFVAVCSAELAAALDFHCSTVEVVSVDELEDAPLDDYDVEAHRNNTSTSTLQRRDLFASNQ